jgi:hypothetical protein
MAASFERPTMIRCFWLASAFLLTAATFGEPGAPVNPKPRPRVEFTRLIDHLVGYEDPSYLKFIEDVKPEVVQVGWYGAHMYGPSPYEKWDHGKFSQQTLRERGQYFENLNRELHQRGVKVVGHFNIEFLVGDPDGPDGPRGFFKYFRDLWDEKELGPRPADNLMDLLERGPDGKPIIHNQYAIGGMKEYWACLNNPKWRAVLKAWVKAGIRRGADGYIANYFYRHNCVCPHCVQGFKDHLRGRYSPEQLRERFGVADLAAHQFTEIVGWHDPKESTPLRREMLRFSQIGTKKAFDEVFIQYGRSLKPDLIVAQWNHLGDFGQINGDERCMLPAELWGKDEDYLWYSTGASAYFTDLEKGFLGEGTLQARYIRGAFDNKPFTLGKYESSRTRVIIAELAANGGAPMGMYSNFTDALARQEMVRYFTFLRNQKDLYHANRPHAEVVLLYPRSRVHDGDVASVDAFKKVGKHLLDDHILFDVLPDDIATPERLKPYRHVVKATDPEKALPLTGLSRFEAPQTVRVSASQPARGGEITLHFVNYNRREPKEKRSAGTGAVDENPIAVEGVKAALLAPAGSRVVRVEVLTPEDPTPVVLQTETKEGRVGFTIPRFLVYAIARVVMEPAGK